MNKSLFIGLAASLATVAVPATARAVDAKDWLVYCVGDDPDTIKAIHESVADKCGVKVGNKAACSVVKGTPWTCSNKKINNSPPQPPADDYCGYKELSISLEAGVALPGKWTVKAAANIEYKTGGKKKPKASCGADPKEPPPTEGKGGEFVSDSGTIKVEAKWIVTGTLKLSNPAGVSVDLTGTGTCDNGSTFQYYEVTEVNDCPCATTTTMRTASGDLIVACDVTTPEEDPLPVDPDPITDPVEPDPIVTDPLATETPIVRDLDAP